MYAKQKKKDIELIPAQYGEAPPTDDKIQGREVYIVDFSYPREILERLHGIADQLEVIDHHETAEKELGGLEYALFNNKHSGAVLTWKHFYPHFPVPLFLLYIEDRDLWRFELPFSREFAAGLWTEKFDPEVWMDHLRVDSAIKNFQAIGSVILRREAAAIEKATYNPKTKEEHRIEIDGVVVPFTNTTTLISEVCNELAKDHPFATTFFVMPEKTVWNLRSDAECPDAAHVGAIAVKYGGGGHKNAAGFSVPNDRLSQIFKEKKILPEWGCHQ
jgi:oligoribonuclease NrnB/cAMP/cGMP phosphodiesterase (DHH superfamily)